MVGGLLAGAGVDVNKARTTDGALPLYTGGAKLSQKLLPSMHRAHGRIVTSASLRAPPAPPAGRGEPGACMRERPAALV